MRRTLISLFFCTFLFVLFFTTTVFASSSSNLFLKLNELNNLEKYSFHNIEGNYANTTTPSSISNDVQTNQAGVTAPDAPPPPDNTEQSTEPGTKAPTADKPSKVASKPTKTPITVKIKPTPSPKPTPLPKSTPGPDRNTKLTKKENNPSTDGLNYKITKASLENFINNKNLASTGNYLVWVNTNTIRAYIFSKLNDVWKLSRTFICTVGKDSTPTVKGVFQTQAKAYFVFDKKYNCYLKYVTKVYMGYLFHSVILNKDGKVTDGTLGEKKSHGCMRFSLTDSKWLYETLPLGTTVFIN